MANHILKLFDEELNKLRYRLVKMGTLVQEQIEYSINSLLEDKKELANIVLEIEKKVDNLDIKIDKQCLRIFALHQPVALDLRLVLSAISINDNMELIGDLASNIAKNVKKMTIQPGILKKTKFEEMGKVLDMIITKLMDSFVNVNKELALEAIKSDSEIMILFDQNFKLINDLMVADNELIEYGCYLIDINRNIQAISRQARSIAQELVFLFEAKMIKHLSLDEIYNQSTSDSLIENDVVDTE
jgi:phosphate transport system protein